VILELGNELHQAVADRYVNGAAVPADSVRMIWEDNTQSPLLTSMSPMYAAVLHTARAINATLPPARRVRVLLGDPAVEWRTVTREALWEIHKRRGDRMRELARDSVVGRGRRGIVIAGMMHLRRDWRGGKDARRDATWGDLQHRVFVIAPHNGFGGRAARLEPVLDSLPPGTLLHVRGTFLADLLVDDAAEATPAPGASPDSVRVTPTPPGMVRTNAGLRFGDRMDGYLYLGPVTAYTYDRVDLDRIRRDPARVAELHRRSCMMMGRPIDTTRYFRVPDSLYYARGVRPNRVEFDPPGEPPAAPPPLPSPLPAPCATLLGASPRD
jgi:hypothetical protein